MINQTQLYKGLLEGCILKIISLGETYGYEISEKLMKCGFEHISEGSIYPILIRLEKHELLKAILKESPYGPKRKYYYLTEEGEVMLSEFIDAWRKLKLNIDNVLGDEGI